MIALEFTTSAKLLTDYVRYEPCRLRLGVPQPLGIETTMALLRHFDSSHYHDLGLLEMDNAYVPERLPGKGKQLTRI